LNKRAHAPAIESHRGLAAGTLSACRSRSPPQPSSSSPVAWIVLLPEGDVLCSPEELSTALWSSSSEAEAEAAAAEAGGDVALAFDHVYGGGGDGGGSFSPEATAILYGVVGSPAMMGFHRVLKAAAETGTVRYVFRHALPYGVGDGDGDGGGGGGSGEATPLQGYGVVLDVKNMEYQNFDSTSPDSEEVSELLFVYE
ncbi:unnamed protein product, partial [Laminaria digitata]